MHSFGTPLGLALRVVKVVYVVKSLVSVSCAARAGFGRVLAVLSSARRDGLVVEPAFVLACWPYTLFGKPETYKNRVEWTAFRVCPRAYGLSLEAVSGQWKW